MVVHERWTSAVMGRSAAPQWCEMGASSVCGRQDTEEICSVILQGCHVIHAAYVQEMGRDEDLRSFTIAYPY